MTICNFHRSLSPFLGANFFWHVLGATSGSSETKLGNLKATKGPTSPTTAFDGGLSLVREFLWNSLLIKLAKHHKIGWTSSLDIKWWTEKSALWMEHYVKCCTGQYGWWTKILNQSIWWEYCIRKCTQLQHRVFEPPNGCRVVSINSIKDMA